LQKSWFTGSVYAVVSQAEEMRKSFDIRLASELDVPFLPDIERRASALFLDWAEDLGLTAEGLQQVTSEDILSGAQREGRLWVATVNSGEVVGFALVLMVDDLAHLKEVDVLPDHGRKGIGTSLVRAVCRWAEHHGIPAVTLSTFREVPWNAPFYARLGFHVASPTEVSPGHKKLMDSERDRGLRSDLRVLMRYKTGDG
jgi:GNAT superfamily N-acetyltransferase